MSKKAKKRERQAARAEWIVYALSTVAVPVVVALIYAWAQRHEP